MHACSGSSLRHPVSRSNGSGEGEGERCRPDTLAHAMMRCKKARGSGWCVRARHAWAAGARARAENLPGKVNADRRPCTVHRDRDSERGRPVRGAAIDPWIRGGAASHGLMAWVMADAPGQARAVLNSKAEVGRHRRRASWLAATRAGLARSTGSRG